MNSLTTRGYKHTRN